VPVALVVGDKATTLEASELLGPNLKTVAVKEAYSRTAARSLPIERALALIRGTAKAAVEDPHPEPFVIKPPINVGIEFTTSLHAHNAATLPGARLVGGRRVEWTGKDLIEALRGMEAMMALS
jgi:D-aminopeptidase